MTAVLICGCHDRTASSPETKSQNSEKIVLENLTNNLELINSQNLKPNTDNNFMLVAWFKLSKPLAQDERLLLFGNISKDHIPGFGVRLIRDEVSSRFELYWAAKNKPIWYSLADYAPETEEWFPIVFNVSKDMLVSLHTIDHKTGVPELLGAMNFQNRSLPDLQANLQFIKLGKKSKLQLGAYYIYNYPDPEKMSENLNLVLKSAKEIPSDLKKFCISASIDLQSDLCGKYSYLKKNENN